MKKILTLALLAVFVLSCGSDDDPKEIVSSIVFYQPADITLPNCVIGYKKDSKFIKIKEMGDLYKDTYSEELWMSGNTVKELYLFSDYNSVVRFDTVFVIKENDRNTFEISDKTKLIPVTDKEDPAQYPQ
ncbi:hypothetical protein GGR21_003057 [Dysgonomonas hofstadii]|uniref:Lipoprotein n=1 Tax=Dysgonomonas hofstadii TaxID=637886 RepID=A0A840CXI7_9BACT|nr:hypothetical protein [Dysgonomonas hofstadii]MBB4037142.1 hypothetical protein [Dysgonomonas hofstadii]